MDFKAEIEKLTKMLQTLEDAVKKGISTEAIQAAVKAQIEDMRKASVQPVRRGIFAGGPIVGLPIEKAVQISPRYKAAAWAPPSATNPMFTPDVEELAKHNDALVISAMLLSGKNNEDAEARDPNAVKRAVVSMKSTHPKAWGFYQERYTELGKALDSATATEGLEFVPTGFSQDLIDRIRIAARTGELFREIQMPTDPFKLPAKAIARKRAKQMSESKEDNAAKAPAVTPGTRSITLDAKKLAARVLWSLDLDEDSIIAMGPFLRDEIIEAVGYALEGAYINGDTTATHQDTDTAALAADVAEKVWKGLRKNALANSATVDLSTFNAANLIAMRTKLGRYGADPRKLAWIVSVVGLAKLMGLAELITLDKLGPQATILTGQVAQLFGSPVIVSEEVRDDVDATGVNGSSGNTKSTINLVNRDGFLRGQRRALTVKQKQDIETDQEIIVATWRGDFVPTFGDSEKLSALGINFS